MSDNKDSGNKKDDDKGGITGWHGLIAGLLGNSAFEMLKGMFVSQAQEVAGEKIKEGASKVTRKATKDPQSFVQRMIVDEFPDKVDRDIIRLILDIMRENLIEDYVPDAFNIHWRLISTELAGMSYQGIDDNQSGEKLTTTSTFSDTAMVNGKSVPVEVKTVSEKTVPPALTNVLASEFREWLDMYKDATDDDERFHVLARIAKRLRDNGVLFSKELTARELKKSVISNLVQYELKHGEKYEQEPRASVIRRWTHSILKPIAIFTLLTSIVLLVGGITEFKALGACLILSVTCFSIVLGFNLYEAQLYKNEVILLEKKFKNSTSSLLKQRL